MKIISLGRRKGKTWQLLELAKDEPGYNLIVCCNRNAVDVLWKIIREKKYRIPMPITHDEFISSCNRPGASINKYFIDDADMLIQKMTFREIGAITITK